MAESLCTGSRIVDENVLVATINVGEIREPSVAYDLRNQMLALVRDSGVRNLVIDCRNLGFMGSIGFLSFLGVRRELPGRIVLCHLSPLLRETFDICRLIRDSRDGDAPFEAAEKLDDALALLGQSSE
jgi:anti-anti-sigma factor